MADEAQEDQTTEEVTEEKADEGAAQADSLIEQFDQALKDSDAPKTEEKSDAQVTSEHADNDKSEKKSDSKAEDKTEEKQPEWYEEILDEAKEHGLNKRQVKKFSSRADYDHAINLIGKIKGEADERKVQDEVRDEKQEEKGEPKAKDEGYKVQLDPEMYDQDLISELDRMRDHYEDRLSALEEALSISEQEAEEQKFDGIVDSLGYEDLFGKTGSEDEDAMDRRKELYTEVIAYIAGKEAGGQAVSLSKDLVTKMARSLFYDELVKKEIRSRTQKLSRQSNGRQGGSPTRTNDTPREDPRDEFDRMYRELSGN